MLRQTASAVATMLTLVLLPLSSAGDTIVNSCLYTHSPEPGPVVEADALGCATWAADQRRVANVYTGSLYSNYDPESGICTGVVISAVQTACTQSKLAQKTVGDVALLANSLTGVVRMVVGETPAEEGPQVPDIYVSAEQVPTQIPASAGRCANAGGAVSVCMHVQGKGGRVDEWRTWTWQRRSDGCLRPSVTFWKRPYDNPGAYIPVQSYQWPHGCMQVSGGSSDTLTWVSWVDGPLYFDDQDQVCASWEPSPPMSSGVPCVRIIWK